MGKPARAITLEDIWGKLLEHDGRFDAIDRRLDAHEAHLIEHDARFDAQDAKFISHDVRFASIDEQFALVDHRFDVLAAATQNEFMELRREMGREMKTLENRLLLAIESVDVHVSALASRWSEQFEALDEQVDGHESRIRILERSDEQRLEKTAG